MHLHGLVLFPCCHTLSIFQPLRNDQVAKTGFAESCGGYEIKSSAPVPKFQ